MEAFLADHADRIDQRGRKQVVRNGYLPVRTIMTGADPTEIEQPRVRDKALRADEWVVFTSAILPPYLRKSRSIEELIPWLYLKGVSTGGYGEAFQALLGMDAKGLSPNVIVRLKERWGQECEEWSHRDLSGEEFVSIWADGINVHGRLEDEGNQKQCLLVLMGATAEGRKELIAVVDGFCQASRAGRSCSSTLSSGGAGSHRSWPLVMGPSGPRFGRSTRRPRTSSTSSKNMVPNTRRRAAASSRIETFSWPSTTSRLCTGVTYE